MSDPDEVEDLRARVGRSSMRVMDIIGEDYDVELYEATLALEPIHERMTAAGLTLMERVLYLQSLAAAYCIAMTGDDSLKKRLWEDRDHD